jgi:hypothetical protein
MFGISIRNPPFEVLPKIGVDPIESRAKLTPRERLQVFLPLTVPSLQWGKGACVGY